MLRNKGAPGAAFVPPHNHRSRGSVRSTAYVILLLLSYSFGRYTSTAPAPAPAPQPIINTLLSAQNSASMASSSNNETDCIQPKQDNQDDDDHNVFGPVCGAGPVPDVRQLIIDRVFNGKSPWMEFPPAHVANLLRPRRVQGWGSTGAVFGNLIKRVKPKVIIEIGTFLGASALHMVELTRGSPETQILCVDDFRGWPGFEREAWARSDDIKTVNGDVMLMYQFMQNVVQANATEKVMFLPFSTGSGLQKLCEWGVLADLIEVDAGHDFHSAWSDINRAYKILRRPGGVLFGHDYNTAADNRGVRRAVDRFANLHNLRVRVDGQHWVLHHTHDHQ